MNFFSEIDQLCLQHKQNRWMRYFTVFTRILLAWGFLPSGFTKIIGERFTSLAIKHPMGNYLEALHHTGYYYTFIGVAQMTAAILLLIPRTATLGALLYFPIILNICVLSLAVCFEGSLISSPLMLLASIYLLCWDYDTLKNIFVKPKAAVKEQVSNTFPFKFFGAGFLVIVLIITLLINVYDIMPRNSVTDCNFQCTDDRDPQACEDFCDCIHKEGLSYDKCLERYKNGIRQNEPK